FKKRREAIVVAFVLVLIASMMSFTRAAWLGLLIGSAIYLLLFRRNIFTIVLRNIHYFILFFVISGAASYFLFTTFKIGNLTLYEIYGERVNNILQYESGTGSSRLLVWQEATRLWLRHPMLGNGTDSVKVLGSLTTMPKFGPTYWI